MRENNDMRQRSKYGNKQKRANCNKRQVLYKKVMYMYIQKLIFGLAL